MNDAQTQDRWSKFGKWAGLAAFSFFLAKGMMWLAIPGLILGSCAK